MVKISVIVPTYNQEKYLKQCLDSIMVQSFEDFEVILVNDGSTDKTPDILNDYAQKDNRVKIFSIEHEGLGHARNVGLDNAKGDYIYFCDSDDYLYENTLEAIHSIASERNLDLLIFKLVNFNEATGETDYDYSNMPFLARFNDEVFGLDDIKDDILKIDVTVYTKLFKRELLTGIRFDEELIFEDNLFFIECIFEANRISFLDECLYNRRIHENSVISSASENHADVIAIFNRISDKFKEYGHYGEFKEKLFMRKVDAVHYRYGLINPQFKDYFFGEMKRDYALKQEEYERELDFSRIDERSKTLFYGVINSNSPRELEIELKIAGLERKVNDYKEKNRKLKAKNKSLKSQNREILNSRSWKITEPLRKLKKLR